MFCTQCGAQNSDQAKFCKTCGGPLGQIPEVAQSPVTTAPMQTATPINESAFSGYQPASGSGGGVGFSPRINDPAFAKYQKNNNRWSLIFAVIMAVIAVVGFTIYGQVSDEVGNPGSFFIGLGIGGMFIVIALFQVMGRKTSKPFDGQVVDKKSQKKKRTRNQGDDDTYTEHYTEYTVVIRDQAGKEHKLRAENDTTVYDYYQVGDYVRFHAGLNSYEKYDKSRDTIIFCNACASLNDIHDDYCKRCKCPLLKS